MYKIGQQVCLWQIRIVPGSRQITVLKEVIVRITEVKTGVPSQFSREPVNLQSLRGEGDDGKCYDKHWEHWPESQANDGISQWSPREDGVIDDNDPFWIPAEAVYVYDAVSRHQKQRDEVLRLINQNNADIRPKGDIAYCERHDRYWHAGSDCIFCSCGMAPA